MKLTYEAELTPFLSEGSALDLNARVAEGLQRRLPLRLDPTLATLVRPSDLSEPLQRAFHYREGYTVELCRRYLAADDELVVDPFCGFGSSLIAAQEFGVPSVGFDVNPLATFVTRVKSRKYSTDEVMAAHQFRESLVSLTPGHPAAPTPELRILPKLFHPQILHAVSVFKHAIWGLADTPSTNLAKLSWLATLETLSNVYREGNGVKYRNRLRRGNTYTHVPYDEWADRAFPDDKLAHVRDTLLNKYDAVLNDAELTSANSIQGASVYESDSRTMGDVIADGSASLAIFSPPYCNCFNYIKAYKVELWMGGYISSYSDISRLTGRGIRSRLEGLTPAAKGGSLHEVDQIAELIAGQAAWSPSLPDVVRGYFEDMASSLRGVHKSLRKGGRAVVVVGNSALAGVLIPTDLLLARIAEGIGFEVSAISVARHLTTSSQQRLALSHMKEYMRESVIELVK